MILSYLLAALFVLFAPLAHGRPTETSALEPHRLPSSSSVEPDTLLGRHYFLQGRQETSYSDHTIQATTKDDRTSRASRRANPFPKYIADRSDIVWVRKRVRRAEQMIAEPIAESNYVSHVGSYSYSPPAPHPVIAAASPPTSTSLMNVTDAKSTSAAAVHEGGKSTHKKEKGKNGHKGGKERKIEN